MLIFHTSIKRRAGVGSDFPHVWLKRITASTRLTCNIKARVTSQLQMLTGQFGPRYRLIMDSSFFPLKFFFSFFKREFVRMSTHSVHLCVYLFAFIAKAFISQRFAGTLSKVLNYCNHFSDDFHTNSEHVCARLLPRWCHTHRKNGIKFPLSAHNSFGELA